LKNKKEDLNAEG